MTLYQLVGLVSVGRIRNNNEMNVTWNGGPCR
jgi:hypothetical protein